MVIIKSKTSFWLGIFLENINCCLFEEKATLVEKSRVMTDKLETLMKSIHRNHESLKKLVVSLETNPVQIEKNIENCEQRLSRIHAAM
jgi:septal ring factor EnvC (AmiA/AmiB activator)